MSKRKEQGWRAAAPVQMIFQAAATSLNPNSRQRHVVAESRWKSPLETEA